MTGKQKICLDENVGRIGLVLYPLYNRECTLKTSDVNIIGINASVVGGATDGILAEMLGGCRTAASKNRRWRKIADIIHTENISLEMPRWNLPLFFRGHEPTETVMNILEKLKTADGIILASPVHWFTMSAAMKNLLDWCVLLEEGWPLNGKPVGFGACGDTDGGQDTVSAMAQVMAHLRCAIPADAMFFRNTSITKRGVPSGCEQEWMVKDAPLVGAAVAETALRRKFGP